MRRITLILFCLVYYMANAETKVFTYHPDGDSVICYYDENKNYKAVEIYPDKQEHGIGLEVNLLYSSENGLLIEFFDGESLWVNLGDVGINNRNLDGTFLLYSSPNMKSKTTPIINTWELRVYGISEDWLYVKASVDGKDVFGWMAPIDQCPSQRTTCP